jgi:heterodisulfide reductase subunit A-like polyferredoxin
MKYTKKQKKNRKKNRKKQKKTEKNRKVCGGNIKLEDLTTDEITTENLKTYIKEIDNIAIKALTEITDLNSKIKQFSVSVKYNCTLINDFFDDNRKCPSIYPDTQEPRFNCNLNVIKTFFETVKSIFDVNSTKAKYKNDILEIKEKLFNIRNQLNILIDYANEKEEYRSCEGFPIERIEKSLTNLDKLIRMY